MRKDWCSRTWSYWSKKKEIWNFPSTYLSGRPFFKTCRSHSGEVWPQTKTLNPRTTAKNSAWLWCCDPEEVGYLEHRRDCCRADDHLNEIWTHTSAFKGVELIDVYFQVHHQHKFECRELFLGPIHRQKRCARSVRLECRTSDKGKCSSAHQ